MSIFIVLSKEGVDVSKITFDGTNFPLFFLKRRRERCFRRRKAALLETDGGEDFLSSGQNKSKRTTTTTVRSLLLLSTRGGKEKERERRAHDATTRGSNARRIATMTAAEDVPTRPLTEYIFGFFSL